MKSWHSYIHDSFGCEVDLIREFVQEKQTPISMEGGQFSSGKQRHIEHCACVLERWTDSRCLKLDCIRERKKVTSSVNEKQKSSGFSLSFVGHPQCRSAGLAEKVLRSVNKSLFPRPFICLSVCLSLSSYLFPPSFLPPCTLSTHPSNLTGQQSFAAESELSCHLKSCEGAPQLSPFWLPSGITLWHKTWAWVHCSQHSCCAPTGFNRNDKDKVEQNSRKFIIQNYRSIQPWCQTIHQQESVQCPKFIIFQLVSVDLCGILTC